MGLTKIILGTLVVGAGAAGIVYASRLNNLQNRLEVITRVNIDKVDFSGITLRIDVLFQNPSQGTVNIKFPTVRMYYGSSFLASSDVINKDFTIPRYGQIAIDPIYLKLSTGNIVSSVPKLLADVRKDGILNLKASVYSLVNGTIPYEKSENISPVVPEGLRSLLRLTA